MFKIENGRLSFYQWDINQRLIIEDASINEVHFSNRTSDYALVCEVYEENGLRLVDVPNILLQDDWTIRVYAYCANYTKIEENFIVFTRSKPADYVYTETEIKTFSLLEERMDELENTVSVEGVAKAVEEYLTVNPPQAGATGPQGPKGEKGDTGPTGDTGKSAYAYAVEGGYTGTEAEFAAKLAEEMPTTLPNPNALTFTGAVTGSYDGSAALSVEIPSGGGEKEWALISTVEVGADELVASIKTPTEDEMKLYSEIFCRFTSFTKTKDGEDTASTSSFRPFIDKTYGDNGRISADVNNTIGSTSSSRVAEVYCTIKANCISGYAQNASYSISAFSALRHTFNQFQNIPQISFNNHNAYYYCSGTKLEVWAR